MSTDIAPPRAVGFWGTALFPVNGMIGAGIFALPAVLVAAVGQFAPWMMILGGLLFLPLVLVFAWLSMRFDHSGGPVLYGEAAFGKFVGFQAGWARYASSMVTVAANTHVMVTYLAALWPFFDGPVVRPMAVGLFILLTSAINLFSMSKSVGALGLMTVIKVGPLIALVVAAAIAGADESGFALPQFSEFESVVLLTYYAFLGFEVAVTSAGEMKRPKRDLPLALITTLAAVTLLYVAVIWAYIAIAPGGDGSQSALAASAGVVMGPVGSAVIVFAAAVSIGANNFNGGINMPRMTYGMAEQGMLPRWFLTVSPRWKTPANSIYFYAASAITFGLWAGFEVLAVAGTLVRLITYLVSAAALPVIEHREGRLNPVHAAVSLIAFASTLWVATHANSQAWQMLGVLVAAGAVLYFIAARDPRSAG